MENNSPLRVIDRGVSVIIYHPTVRAKQWKSMVNDQYKYHLKDYLDYKSIMSVYNEMNAGCIHYKIPVSFIDYLNKKYKGKPRKKRKREIPITEGNKRARNFRIEANKMKREISKTIINSTIHLHL